MSMRIQRFDFGSLHDFRGPIAVKTIADLAPKAEVEAAPPAPVFTEADIEAATLAGRKQGYAEGFAAGIKEEKNRADLLQQRANEALVQTSDMLSLLRQQYTQLIQTESDQLSRLVLSIARKIANEAIDARGEKEAVAIVERCLPVIFTKPKLNIELHPGLFETAVGQIETLLRAQGFEGEIAFRSNEVLGPSDIVLDWGVGSMRRSTGELWQEIEDIMARVPLEITFAETLANAEQNTGE